MAKRKPTKRAKPDKTTTELLRELARQDTPEPEWSDEELAEVDQWLRVLGQRTKDGKRVDVPAALIRMAAEWLEWHGWANPYWPPAVVRGIRDRQHPRHVTIRPDGTAVAAKPPPTTASVAAHGKRYRSDDGDDLAPLLDAVKRSGAKSKNEYDTWRAAQSTPGDWPTYKTLQRRITGKRKPGAAPGPDLRKPGESAWDAAYRLSRR